MDTELLEFRIEQSSVFDQSSYSGVSSVGGTRKSETTNLHYGKFYLSGLKKGQGITVANALRRVLLYDIFGIGITKVNFTLPEVPTSSTELRTSQHGSPVQPSSQAREGLTGSRRREGPNSKEKIHEFSTISGMRESILELLMNLRLIVWKKNQSQSFIGKCSLADIIQRQEVSVDHQGTSPESISSSNGSPLPPLFILRAKHLLNVPIESEKASSLGYPSTTPPMFSESEGTREPVMEVVNPEHYLATFLPIPNESTEQSLFSNKIRREYANLQIEFKVENGSAPSANIGINNSHPDMEENPFLLDSGPFFPIKKVNYTVEATGNQNLTKNVSFGRGASLGVTLAQGPTGENCETVFSECVFFEIWTDGSLHPEKALSQAFSILADLFQK